MHARCQAYFILIGLCALVLASCTARTAVPTSTTLGGPPVKPPLATLSPQTTSQPVSTTALPAPLYFIAIDDGQVYRLERDGQTTRQLTAEASPVLSFDPAPNGTDLIYLIGDAEQRTVVLLSQGKRLELLYGAIERPIFDPSGEQILVRIADPEPGLIIGQDSAPPGIYAQQISGGRPSLVLADRPKPGAATGTSETFTPFDFSPTGNMLLLVRDAPDGLDQLGLYDPALGDVLRLPCCAYAWSPDRATLYVGGSSEASPSQSVIVRLPAAGGAPIPLAGSYASVDALYAEASGSLLGFIAPLDSPLGSEIIVDMQRISPDGATTRLRDKTYPLYNAAWATDGSGAVISLYVAGGADQPFALESLRWLPTNPAAPEIELAGRGDRLRFGKGP